MQNNTLETLKEEEWDKFINSILAKFVSNDFAIDNFDLRQEAWLALLNACRTYDPTKAKFTTHAWINIYGHLQKLIRNETNRMFEIEEINEHIAEKSDNVLESNDLFDTITKSDIYHPILYDRFVDKMTLRELSEKYDVSHETIRRTISNLIAKINERY